MCLDYFLRIALIAILSIASAPSHAGYRAPRSASICNTMPQHACRATITEAQADYNTSWPWKVINPNTNQCGEFTLVGPLQWNGSTVNFTYTSAWAPPPPNDNVSGSHALETCQTTCSAIDTPAGSYYIHTGDNPDSLHQVGFGHFCDNGCDVKTLTIIDITQVGDHRNSPDLRKLVDGVYQYYSYRSFFHTGQTCTSGSPLAVAATVPAKDQCAPMQSMIQMGSRIKCIDPSTGQEASPNSASSVAAAKTLSDADVQKAIADAKAAAAAAGGSASAVEAAGAAAAAKATGDGTSDSAKDPVMAQFCKDNPDSPMCVGKDFGEVTDVDLTNKDINVSITPILDGALGQAGSCPAPRAISLGGQTKYFDYTTFCNFSNGIRPVILAFAWLLAAGILVGGFKSA